MMEMKHYLMRFLSLISASLAFVLNQQEGLFHSTLNLKSVGHGSKKLSSNAMKTTGATGASVEWNVFSHEDFPRYKLRTKTGSKLCDPSVKQITGYLDVDDDKHFFFWFFESRSKPATDPLVLWLNGGPGCSSLTGLLMELGPCRVNPSGEGTTLNQYSWNSNANIIFLDQVKTHTHGSL